VTLIYLLTGASLCKDFYLICDLDISSTGTSLCKDLYLICDLDISSTGISLCKDLYLDISSTGTSLCKDLYLDISSTGTSLCKDLYLICDLHIQCIPICLLTDLNIIVYTHQSIKMSESTGIPTCLLRGQSLQVYSPVY
jgi:hypothetical protein